MDLQQLHTNGIISQETLDWIRPLWEAEIVEAAGVKEANRSNNLFGDDDDDDDDDEILSQEIIPNFLGIRDFTFWMDDHSTGHGNHVWHASIATCMYLKHYYSLQQQQQQKAWQSMELGAGTFLPSLFLGHLVANDSHVHPEIKPVLHITDGKQYRNIRQILFSLSNQPTQVRESASFRVSPHNWGQNIDVFLAQESASGGYDLIIVSDCIYNPTYHRDLLKTIAATLRLPATPDDPGGRVILTFSLHGNTPDRDIWNFIDRVIPEETCHDEWKLQARPVQDDLMTESFASFASSHEKQQPVVGRHGWDMEETMKELGLWTANIEPKRWFSFLYEIMWAK